MTTTVPHSSPETGSTTHSLVIATRVDARLATRLRAIADRNASTVSRTVARILAERLDSYTLALPIDEQVEGR